MKLKLLVYYFYHYHLSHGFSVLWFCEVFFLYIFFIFSFLFIYLFIIFFFASQEFSRLVCSPSSSFKNDVTCPNDPGEWLRSDERNEIVNNAHTNINNIWSVRCALAWTLVPFILSLLGECWSYSDSYGYHVKQRKTRGTMFCIELIKNGKSWRCMPNVKYT